MRRVGRGVGARDGLGVGTGGGVWCGDDVGERDGVRVVGERDGMGVYSGAWTIAFAVSS